MKLNNKKSSFVSDSICSFIIFILLLLSSALLIPIADADESLEKTTVQLALKEQLRKKINIANRLLSEERISDAETLISEIVEKSGAQVSMEKAYPNMFAEIDSLQGMLHLLKGAYEKDHLLAINEFKQALKWFEKRPDGNQDMIANAYLALAEKTMQMNRLGEAEIYLSKVIGITSVLDLFDKKTMAEIYLALSEVKSRGELEIALESAEQALLYAKSATEQIHLIAKAQYYVAYFSYAVQDYHKSVNAFHSTIEYLEHIPKSETQLVNAYMGLAKSNIGVGNLDESNKAAENALRILDTLNKMAYEKIEVLKLIASNKKSLGLSEDALFYYGKVETIYTSQWQTEKFEHSEYISLLSDMADISFSEKKYQSAEPKFMAIVNSSYCQDRFEKEDICALAKFKLGLVNLYQNTFNYKEDYLSNGYKSMWHSNAKTLTEEITSIIIYGSQFDRQLSAKSMTQNANYSQQFLNSEFRDSTLNIVGEKESTLSLFFMFRDLIFTESLKRPENSANAAWAVSVMTKSLVSDIQRSLNKTWALQSPKKLNALHKTKREISHHILSQDFATDFGDSITPLLDNVSKQNDFTGVPGSFSSRLNSKKKERFRRLVELIDKKILQEQELGLDSALDRVIQLSHLSISNLLKQVPSDSMIVDYFVIPKSIDEKIVSLSSDKVTSERDFNHYGAFVAIGGNPYVAIIDLGNMIEIDKLILDWYTEYKHQINPIHFSLNENRLNKHAKKVYQRLIKPILDDKFVKKEKNNINRIYVSPVGPISNVLFEALPVKNKNSNQSYLIEDYEIVYLESPRDLFRYRKKTPKQTNKNHILVGDPMFGKLKYHTGQVQSVIPSDWPRLKGTSSLIGNVAKDLESMEIGVDVYLRENAQEKLFAEMRSPTSLLIATHGIFLNSQISTPTLKTITVGGKSFLHPVLNLAMSNDMRNMIVLSGANRRCTVKNDNSKQNREKEPACIEGIDGLLTGYEISDIKLSETELVVLFGCESGLGGHVLPPGKYKIPKITYFNGSIQFEDGDPISLYTFSMLPGGANTMSWLQNSFVGLRQGFIVSGSHSLISTLWTIPLKPHQKTIQSFYQNWLGKKYSRYEAFYLAQIDALTRARTSGDSHPFWWAGFTYVGDPGDVK